MNRPRDRRSADGLLPRMEARPRKDGTIMYRYKPKDGKPIPLGDDRLLACQRVLDLLRTGNDEGTIGRLWSQYKDSTAWEELKPRTRADYEDYSIPLLKVFGKRRASGIEAPDVARYLRRERKTAPIRANREVALLGNLIAFAIERGEAKANPCRGGQVKRNRERPKDTLPQESDIRALIDFAETKASDTDGERARIAKQLAQWRVMMLAAEFAALTGARQAEFLPLHWPAFGETEVRLERAKQRLGVKKIDRVAISPALSEVRMKLLAFQRSPMGAVFPTRTGNVYTASGFASNWQKLVTEALAKGIITERFNFHALRAYYATHHKLETGALPDMHASPTTTAKVYDRAKETRRKAL